MKEPDVRHVEPQSLSSVYVQNIASVKHSRAITVLVLTRQKSWCPGEYEGPTGEMLDGSDPPAKREVRAPCSIEALVSCSSGLEDKTANSSGGRGGKGLHKLQMKNVFAKNGEMGSGEDFKNNKKIVLEAFLLCLRRLCTSAPLRLHALDLLRLYPPGARFTSPISTERQQGDPDCRLYRGCHLT